MKFPINELKPGKTLIEVGKCMATARNTQYLFTLSDKEKHNSTSW